jgi:hypothetical protein
LVANWVEVLGPVATAPHAEVAWPETIAVDSTKFMITNPVTNRSIVGFNALAVWGYPSDEPTGRLWAIRAVPEAKTSDWTALFESQPGTPTLMICDLAQAPISAARLTWGPSGPHVKYCEWHRGRCAAELLRPYGISHSKSPEMRLLAEAFRSSKGWKAFKEMATSYTNVDEWVQRHDLRISDQVAHRRALPQHHSAGAVDTAFRRIRAFMEPRAFCYRNAEHTNRMLELVRTHINHADNADEYAATIRTYLDAGGSLSAQGTIRDTAGARSLR